MYIRVLVAALATAFAAGCTSYSGPTHNTDVVTLANGDQAWRVQCQGLLEGAKTCVDQAKKICKDQKIRLIGAVDHMKDDRSAQGDPREITFKCGEEPAPVAQAPVPVPVPVPVPAPKPHALRTLTLDGDANFALNSSELSPLAQRKLDDFIAGNQGYQIDRLTISGYTDSTGSAALNERLSQARAKSAQNYLMSHGLKASSYDVRGFGPASPVATNSTAAGRAKNRRVELSTTGIEISAQ